MTSIKPPAPHREAVLVLISMAVVGLLAPPLIYGLALVILRLR